MVGMDAHPAIATQAVRCPACGGGDLWSSDEVVRADTGAPRSVLARPTTLAVGLLGLLAAAPALLRTLPLLRLFPFRGDVRGDLAAAVLILGISARAVGGALAGWPGWERAPKATRRRYACAGCGREWDAMLPGPVEGR